MMDEVILALLRIAAMGLVGGVCWIAYKWGYDRGYQEGSQDALEELKDLYWTGQLEKPEERS